MESSRFTLWLMAFVLAIQQGVLSQSYDEHSDYNERRDYRFGHYRYQPQIQDYNRAPRYEREIPDTYGNSVYDYGEYDVSYPQYSYQPYSECGCSRVAYEDYRRYQADFRYHWYSEEYPTYYPGQGYREGSKPYNRIVNAYFSYDPILVGNYTYPDTSDDNKPRPLGRKCYQFNPKRLPKRKPCPKKPKNRKCKKGNVRKEYRQLTKSERDSLHAAMQKMKDLGIWDAFANLHMGVNSPFAHGGAAFLPWHREYLFRVEQELFKRGYKGPGLPYWDSSLDQTLPNPSHSAIWTPAYLGNIDGVVNTGPFAGWDSTPVCTNVNAKLMRNGVNGFWGQCLLFSDFDIAYVLSKRCFKDLTCNTDCKFESDHGAVHNFVGGHMGIAPCAPNDPVFYLHHAFVDCLWEEFRDHSQVTDLDTEYPSFWYNDDDIGGFGHEWFSPMIPFGLLNGHGISHWYEKYYKCHRRPSKWRCSRDSDCGGDILWCNNGRCQAKVRNGGDCNGFPNNACDTTECPSGRAVCGTNRRCACVGFAVVANPAVAIAQPATGVAGKK